MANNGRVIPCDDLDRTIEQYQADGFRLDALGPADEPTWAEMSGPDATICLDASPAPLPGHENTARPGRGELRVPSATPELAVAHERGSGWVTGRAGMRYRDLVPGRHGGAYIASHIHVPVGGPVPDYVHHHDIAYQLIFCHRGWVRVIYQDQGPSFVMEPGHCVLQPPGIRHQVLEASDDLYVVEITCPAEHRTNLDHDLALPTEAVLPDRSYGGQRFVHHRADQPWSAAPENGFIEQRTAIDDATDGLAQVRLLEAAENDGGRAELPLGHSDDFRFLFVVGGAADFRSSDPSVEALREGSSVSVPPTAAAQAGLGPGFRLTDIAPGTRLLEVCSTVSPV